MDVDKGRGSLQRTRRLVASTRVTLAERALLEAAAIQEDTTVATLIRRAAVPYALEKLAGTLVVR